MTKLGPFAGEQMRRVAARTTEEIALRWGRDLPMWIGCGYPKSGTVWLCQLMSSYLGVPYPQNYAMPIVMSAVIHAHWPYDTRLPQTAYIVRDGRDVMTSLYFYEMRALSLPRNPRRAAQRKDRYESLFGRDFDPSDVRGNLPGFIDAEMRDPSGLRGVTWHEHVESWTQPHENVTVVRYEDLLEDPVVTFTELMANVTGDAGDEERARLALERHSFARSGRTPGEEDRSSFMRKGVTGDWRNYFTADAGEAFERYAGRALRACGYESDDQWWLAL